MAPSSASSLADTVARRRILYPAPLATAPAVMVIDIPEANRGRGLALGRYYAIIVETDVERDELEAYLAATRVLSALPDLLDRRPTSLWTQSILVMRYAPPSPGWPWLSVARWPDDHARAAREHGIDLARDCYTMELFATADKQDAHHAAMLDSLSSQSMVDVRWLGADMLQGSGTA